MLWTLNRDSHQEFDIISHSLLRRGMFLSRFIQIYRIRQWYNPLYKWKSLEEVEPVMIPNLALLLLFWFCVRSVCTLCAIYQLASHNRAIPLICQRTLSHCDCEVARAKQLLNFVRDSEQRGLLSCSIPYQAGCIASLVSISGSRARSGEL